MLIPLSPIEEAGIIDMETLTRCYYCDRDLQAKMLTQHFGECPYRSESNLYQLSAYILSGVSDANLIEFVEKEMEYELNRLKAYRKQIKGEEKETETCGKCGEKREDLVVLECKHKVCVEHIKTDLRPSFHSNGELLCYTCQKPILHKEIRHLVGSDLFDAVLDEISGPDYHLQGEKVVCSCGFEGSFYKKQVNLMKVDKFGEKISEEAAEIEANYGYWCGNCRESRCLQCQVSPFHEGWTCSEAARLSSGEICRYCSGLPSPNSDHCLRPSCLSLFTQSCQETLPCGHRCFACVNDSQHSICLICGPREQTECVICQETLQNAPVVTFRCGHMVHFDCEMKVLKSRWTGFRISFTFAKCHLCQDWAVTNGNPDINKVMWEVYGLYQVVLEKAMRMLGEDEEEQKMVMDETDKEYYNQHEKYALDRFCFYECCKCKEPYFGGLKQCNLNEDPSHYHLDEMICLNCAVQSGSHTCTRHGVEFMQYKCRYCCNIAKYFCWGTSHFCENCHRRMNAGDDVTKKPQNQLPVCEGGPGCPLKLKKHPISGKEFLVGCALCREEQRL